MDEKMIKSPKHYTEGRKFEPKDVIRDWGLNFNLGNAVKYLARAGRKGDAVEDLKKAQQYIQFEIDALEAEGKEQKKQEPPTHSNCRCSLQGHKEDNLDAMQYGVEFQRDALSLYNAFLYKLQKVRESMEKSEGAYVTITGAEVHICFGVPKGAHSKDVLRKLAENLMGE